MTILVRPSSERNETDSPGVPTRKEAAGSRSGEAEAAGSDAAAPLGGPAGPGAVEGLVVGSGLGGAGLAEPVLGTADWLSVEGSSDFCPLERHAVSTPT
jgi:hypothetical protein